MEGKDSCGHMQTPEVHRKMRNWGLPSPIGTTPLMKNSPVFSSLSSTPQDLKKLIPPPPGFPEHSPQSFGTETDEYIDIVGHLQQKLAAYKTQVIALQRQLRLYEDSADSRAGTPNKYSFNKLIEMLKIEEDEECSHCKVLVQHYESALAQLKAEKLQVLADFHQLYNAQQASKAAQELSQLREHIRSTAIEHAQYIHCLVVKHKAEIAQIQQAKTVESSRICCAKKDQHIKELEEMLNTLRGFVSARWDCHYQTQISFRQARELRRKIHQQVVAIEQGFDALEHPEAKVLSLKQQFLELPYLLKPLFELSKAYPFVN